MPNPDSSNRIFSSRVPNRLSTPRLIRTLDFIKRVLSTSGCLELLGKENDDRSYRSGGSVSKVRQPALAGAYNASVHIIPKSQARRPTMAQEPNNPGVREG